MKLNSPELKRIIWFLGISLLVLSSFIGLRVTSSLFAYFERARVLDDALSLIEPREAEPGRLEWLPDEPLPRPLELIVREGIASDYLLSFEELTYSLLSKDSSGLKSYFQRGALADAILASSAQARSQFVDWDHKLKLHFYAPDGSTIAFTDTYQYAQAVIQGNDLRDIRIAKREIDVIMSLDDGTWRVHHWRVIKDDVQDQTRPQFDNLDEAIKTMRGINYTPRSAPFDAFWPNFNPAELDADFALSSSLGLDTVRFFIPYPLPEGVTQNLPILLDTAKRHKLQLIPTLLDGYTTYRLEDLPRMLNYVETLRDALSHETVLLIDVKNEADRDFKTAGPRRVKTFLSYALNTIRAKTNKPVTIGLIEPEAELAQELDVVSLHHYDSAESLSERLAKARAFAKPVLLEEFGFHTQAFKLPDPHSPQEQALYYSEVLSQTSAQNAGWLAWTLYDLPKGKMPGGREVERHLGIVKANGTPKAVVRVLQGEDPLALSSTDYFVKYRYFFLSIGTSLILLALVYKYLTARKYRQFIEKMNNPLETQIRSIH